MDFLPWIHHITSLRVIIREKIPAAAGLSRNVSVNFAMFVKVIKSRKELWILKKNRIFSTVLMVFAAGGYHIRAGLVIYIKSSNN